MIIFRRISGAHSELVSENLTQDNLDMLRREIMIRVGFWQNIVTMDVWPTNQKYGRENKDSQYMKAKITTEKLQRQPMQRRKS